jgi:hypothetical protein
MKLKHFEIKNEVYRQLCSFYFMDKHIAVFEDMDLTDLDMVSGWLVVVDAELYYTRGGGREGLPAEILAVLQDVIGKKVEIDEIDFFVEFYEAMNANGWYLDKNGNWAFYKSKMFKR